MAGLPKLTLPKKKTEDLLKQLDQSARPALDDTVCVPKCLYNTLKEMLSNTVKYYKGRHQHIEQLRTEISSLKSQNTELENTVETLRSNTQEFRRTSESHRATLAASTTRISILNDELTELHGTLQRREQDNVVLQNWLHYKDQQILVIQTELECEKESKYHMDNYIYQLHEVNQRLDDLKTIVQGKNPKSVPVKVTPASVKRKRASLGTIRKKKQKT